MNILTHISTILFFIISMNILLPQSILDVPSNFKKDFKEYLNSNAENDSVDNIPAFQIDPSLYTSFRVPEFSSKKLNIGSDKFLSYKQTGSSSSFGINIDSDYNYFNQTTYTTNSYSINSIFNSEEKSDAFKLLIPFDFSKYFKQNYSGINGFTSGSMDLNEAKNTNVSGGIGYGRVTSVRPIARAVAIASRVGSDITNEDILEIANIITRQNDGYYENQYKSDADIVFYNELAGVLNAPNETMLIQQIMIDPAFSNISDRKTGWYARLGYGSENSIGGIIINAKYAKPIGFDKQLILGIEASEPSDEVSFTGSYTIDHEISWVSSIDFKFNKSKQIELKTTKDLINKIYTTASITWSENPENVSSIDFFITFNYLAF